MSTGPDQAMLLGKHTPVVDSYTPELLYPIPRGEGRAHIGYTGQWPFHGGDLWHAYEMSWLDANGKPVVRVGKFLVPATSPNMVESKSFKLYLNSLNSTRFASEAEVQATIRRDIGAVAGADIALQLYEPCDPALAGAALAGVCLDRLEVQVAAAEPSADMLLRRSPQRVEEQLYSHLLRSLCPVTGQPDWATVWLHYRGPALDHQALLQYIIAYRRHQEFHEQCVERMFRDLYQCLEPEYLYLQAFYTRRGGLDINPFRSTASGAAPMPRLNRQ